MHPNPKCGHEYLLAFSCKTRCLCTSCHSKRSVIIAERIAEDVVIPVNHRHWVFTLPKILRAYFRRNRKLNGILFESAVFALKKYFSEELSLKKGKIGAILYLQTFGKTGKHHSHLHGLITNGMLDNEGKFHEVAEINQEVVRDLFKNKVFELLQKRNILSPEIINIFSTWRHSGFDVHYERMIDGNDTDEVEDIIRYMTRPPISQEKVIYNYESNTVTYKDDTFTALDFIAQLVSHIPNLGEQVIRLYGVYSNAHKGKVNKSTEIITETKEARKKNKYWARLIQKLFLVDPLLCTKCKGKMKIISFIEDQSVISKILTSLGLANTHGPPARKPPPINDQDIGYQDYIPTVDDYLSDPVYADF